MSAVDYMNTRLGGAARSARHSWIAEINSASVMVGLTAGLGYTFGAVPLFLGATSSLNLSPEARSSWFFIIFFTSAVASLVLTLRYRQPLAIGWTSPGLLLLVSFGDRFTLPELAGAGLVAGVVMLALGLLGLGERAERWIPRPIVMGVFVGSVLSYASGIFTHFAAEPSTVGAALAGYLGARALGRSWLPPMGGAVVAGVGVAGLAGRVQLHALSWSPPQVTPAWPVIDLANILALAVPLVVISLGVGGVQGIGILESQGYRPPTRLITMVIGVNSLINSIFGGHPASMQAQGMAILASPEAGPREQRYVASIVAALCALLLALGANAAGALPSVLPTGLVASLAGLALVSPVLDALRKAVASDLPIGGFFALAIASSSLTAFGIGAAFWALLGGLMVSLLLERGALLRLWRFDGRGS
jgi:benzoate membrane transport protein